jgi:hypothetical protein
MKNFENFKGEAKKNLAKKNCYLKEWYHSTQNLEIKYGILEILGKINSLMIEIEKIDSEMKKKKFYWDDTMILWSIIDLKTLELEINPIETEKKIEEQSKTHGKNFEAFVNAIFTVSKSAIIWIIKKFFDSL